MQSANLCPRNNGCPRLLQPQLPFIDIPLVIRASGQGCSFFMRLRGEVRKWLIYDKHMAKGDNPNSRKNLMQNRKTTPEERRKNAEKAGKASAAKRGVGKQIREYINEFLSANDDEERKQLAQCAIEKSKENLDWFKYTMCLIGEAPQENVDAIQTAGIVLLPKQEVVEGGDQP